MRLSALLSACAVAALLGFLIYFCLPLLRGDALSQLLGMDWRPFQGKFGILPMLAGSLALALAAVPLAFPMAVGVCCFIHGAGPDRAGRTVLRAVKLMTGVPTVVYGFVGVFLLVPLLRWAFRHGSGFSWLAAVAGLVVLILPTMILMIHSQFQVAGPRVRMAATALGLSRAQQLVHLVLPLSRRGFVAALVLGFGRAVGDTMLPLMLSGNAPQLPGSPLDSIRALTTHIALVVATDSHSMAYLSLFAAGLFLFMTTAAVTLALRWVRAGESA